MTVTEGNSISGSAYPSTKARGGMLAFGMPSADGARPGERCREVVFEKSVTAVVTGWKVGW